MGKFRVLCLHGYTQNAQKFRERTGPFRRALKRDLDLVYITAPIQATEFQEPDEGEADEGTKSDDTISSAAWWNRKDGNIWQETLQSIRLVHSAMVEQGPFDGMVGFSQGSGMATLLAALLQAAHSTEDKISAIQDKELRALVREWKAVPAIKFALLFTGCRLDLPQFYELIRCTGKVSIPNLLVLGENDKVVPMERGKRMAEEAFVDTQIMTHEGGHFVPSNAAWKKKYQAFFESLGASVPNSSATSVASSDMEQTTL
ncbi:Ovarian cancer-associated protein 2 [Dipsacomyces acuminosporus]|nr:Ovarian cancer-associated protein 2 [Dipsacomyces acuminosporus]